MKLGSGNESKITPEQVDESHDFCVKTDKMVSIEHMPCSEEMAEAVEQGVQDVIDGNVTRVEGLQSLENIVKEPRIKDMDVIGGTFKFILVLCSMIVFLWVVTNPSIPVTVAVANIVLFCYTIISIVHSLE